jgi:predicted AlkP superfamily pyrophosphatase or phosphodiesterase
MHKKTVLMIVAALFAMLAPLPAAAPPGNELRLILLVAIDQFRYDYLTRFRADYHDGFQKLLTDGAVFTDANLEHYPTVTAIGHSTMLTGATPSVSGIVGNDWYDRASAATVTSVSDSSVTGLGDEGAAGASPRRLLVSTVGDELRMASRVPRGAAGAPKVIGVSLKDRSAILPAGHAADAAYWWNTQTGHFVTSSYYMKELPPWVAAFNGRNPADAWAGQVWTFLSPPASSKTLPADRGAKLYQAGYSSPYGSELEVAFVKEALEREQLGQRGTTDLLTVSFSSNDAVGHTYGPDSPEVRDMAIRTDRLLGDLLATVDRLVGLDHVVIALTADHGVAPVPEVQQERHMPGGRITNQDLFDPIEQALVREFGAGKWILSTAGTSPYLNDALAARVKGGATAVRLAAARAAEAVPHVARVFTRDQLAAGAVGNDRISQRILRGFNAERSGDLEIVLEPYWLRQAQGTTHGTPYNYDAHIPLILMGPRIKPGEYSAAAALNDLAPTLATLAHVEIPSGSSGRVLTEALRPAAGAGTMETAGARAAVR